ncbi:unnamed protein product [Meganyctiphanes norvegica]|uniref:Uncharacterized protein n=1 Tax=Meganyctiphanes norvegica TaxID=48144 RepID=A0AAV2S3M5_MEGNR
MSVDLSLLNLGANWALIVDRVNKLEIEQKLKMAYMLTVREHQLMKAHSGQGINFKYTDSSSGQKEDFIIYFPTRVSNIKDDYITPARFRAAVATEVYNHPKLMVSPAMRVVGFDAVLAEWNNIQRELQEKLNDKDDTSINPVGRKSLHGIDPFPVQFTDMNFPMLYALAPDRVPPRVAHLDFAIELGLAFACLRDIRNRIISRNEAGTHLQKSTKSHAFYETFLKLSENMGYSINKNHFELLAPKISNIATPKFIYPSDTRIISQE